MKNLIKMSKGKLVSILWRADNNLKVLLETACTLKEARIKFINYLFDLENFYLNTHNDMESVRLLAVYERHNARACIIVLKNVCRAESESLTGFSALEYLWKLAKNDQDIIKKVRKGFLCEFINLFTGINAESNAVMDYMLLPDDHKLASVLRTRKLDEYSLKMNQYIKSYKKGTDEDIVTNQQKMKIKILEYYSATEDDWKDYRWHLKHIFRNEESISKITFLDSTEKKALIFARENNVIFEITPFYLSLFNETGKSRHDRVIRAQVLPSSEYVREIVINREKGTDMDFMSEKSTSPAKGITRRYPQIVILKPVDYCPQICVYCQRNWEITALKEKQNNQAMIEKALSWIERNKEISEVLITGGDPLVLPDDYINELLERLSKIDHIERIRIGTRIIVTLPYRITDELIGIISKYHEWGKREICLVTHFESQIEITPEAIEAIKKIKSAGMNVYNQQVFTYYNSLRYETSALRKSLKVSGVDPYYTFNAKGKEETKDFRVPIARIEQERKEEARFLPGLVRTDEPVFNVPRLGKSHLRSWQNHEIVMILPSGQRVYRFLPWESRVTAVKDYIYTDVSIYDYLKRLHDDGHKVKDYKSIWYYF